MVSNKYTILNIFVLNALDRCSSSTSGCGPGCAARGEYNGVPPQAVARAATREMVSDMLTAATMARAAAMNADEKVGRCVGY